MNYSFHPEAEIELNATIAYYEEVEEGLGYDFSVEVYSAVERAASHPIAWPMIDDDIRRCLVRRFPYGILYSVESDKIYVVAVMNLHREPDYWKSRL
jgi:hypothetical protein